MWQEATFSLVNAFTVMLLMQFPVTRRFESFVNKIATFAWH